MTNLLFVTLDDFFSLSAWPMYRDIAITPNLDRFLAQNTQFDAAFADVAVCIPSRAAFLTGQTPWQTGVINNAQDLSQHVNLATETLPGILKGAGFHTAIGGKIYHTLAPRSEDLVLDELLPSEGLRNASSPEYPGIQGINYGATDLPLSDDRLAENVAGFLEDYDGDDPFAVFAGIYRPHVDWIIPQDFLDLYADIDIPLPQFIDTADRALFLSTVTAGFHDAVLEDDAWEPLIRHYLASVSYADARLGDILDALESSDHADSTVTVVLSDHGYHLGEGTLWHKFTTYEQGTRVPLGVSVPGLEAHQIAAPVTLSTLPATVLDLLGLSPTDEMQPSVADAILEGADLTGAHAVTWMNGSISVRSDSYRYTRFENGEEELFALPADIMNLDNLIDDLPDVAAALRSVADAQIGDALLINPTVAQNGGAEDTIYYLRSGPVEITDDGGVDTIYAEASMVLPDALENLHGFDVNSGVVFTGNDKDNRLSGTYGSDTLYGELGDDSLFGSVGADHLYGMIGQDVLDGGSGADYLDGGIGNDILDGEFGDDVLFGREGQDMLYGGPGRDDLHGGPGNDVLWGAFGNDILRGGAGNDRLHGEGGWDVLRGEGGIDTAVLDGFARDFRVLSGSKTDFRVIDDEEQDRLVGIENLAFHDRTLSTDDFFAYSETGILEPLAPVDLGLTSQFVLEHVDGGTHVGTFVVTDPDATDGHELSLFGPAASLFALDGLSLKVAPGARLDFETEALHEVTLRVTDADGLTFEKGFSIGVTDRAERRAAEETPGPLRVSDASETLVMSEDADSVVGQLHEFFNDHFADFGVKDKLVFTDTSVSRADISATFLPTRLSIDLDRDGDEDGAVTLSGDLSGGDFMVVEGDSGSRILTFEHFLPDLEERRALDVNAVNGIANANFLRGDGVTGFRVTLRDMGYAELDNALGVYEVDESGLIRDVQMLFEDVKADPDAEALLSMVEAGHELGFFLVQDGADWARDLTEADQLQFLTKAGLAGQVSDGVDLALSVNGARTDHIVFHSLDPSLNRDGLEHTVSGVDPGGLSLSIGFEDLLGGGDLDYEDVVFRVEASVPGGPDVF